MWFFFFVFILGRTPETPVLEKPSLTEDGLAISLQWNITESELRPVTQYFLFWRVSDDSDSRGKRQEDSGSVAVRQTSYNLTNYTREAVYTFWVVAENGAGRSELSNREEFDVEVEFRLLFLASEQERSRQLAAWAIALIVILCLLCCCICCLLWCILFCCLLGRRKVYHAEEEG